MFPGHAIFVDNLAACYFQLKRLHRSPIYKLLGNFHVVVKLQSHFLNVTAVITYNRYLISIKRNDITGCSIHNMITCESNTGNAFIYFRKTRCFRTLISKYTAWKTGGNVLWYDRAFTSLILISRSLTLTRIVRSNCSGIH